MKMRKRKELNKLVSVILALMMLLGNFLSYGVASAVAGTGTSGDPYTVTEAVLAANQDNRIATVQGYIVGQPTSGTTVLADNFTGDSSIAIADTAGETDTTKILYIQMPTTPANLRADYALKTNPSKMGIKVNITGNLTPYFTPHSGLKTTTAITIVATGNIPVTGVTLDKATLELGVGQISPLVATVVPTTATNNKVTWASDNTAAATVANGVVTAVALGSSNITVTTDDGLKISKCVVTVTDHAPPVNKTFDIVDITDFHGQLLDSTNTKPVGAALAKVVKDVKTTNPDRTLIMGGGDLYQGTPVSNVLRGVPVQQVMSNLGMEVTALGNHEFDWGLDVVNNQTMIGANYSIVCANMYNKGTNVRPYAPYKIITKDGVRIAVIGAILKDAPTIIMPAFVAPYDFKDPATEINLVAKEIKEGNLADIVLADVHDGGASLNTIVNNLHGVDAVFGGHTHTTGDDVIKDADSKDVPTLNAASTGKGFIDLKITVDPTKKIVGFSAKGTNWNALTTTTTSATDPECKKIVDDASAALLPIFNVKIGNDSVAYSSSQADLPYGESQLGNWMADVVKTTAKADVGMVNNGGIRLSPIPAGDITVGTIFNIMPFDNIVTTVTMTGAQLKVLFEQAVADTTGKGLQISGVKFVYDSSKPTYKQAVVAADGSITTPEVPGQRVTSIIRESDNSVLKDTDTLLVAAPDFVATGGDNFTEFTVPAIKATYVDSHVLVRDALTADVTAKGKITVTMNNRVDNQVAVGTAVPMTIAQARTATGSAIITGFVSAVNGKNVFIQDDPTTPTAGICVYNSAGAVLHKGDKITATGSLSIYNGLVEITPASGGVTTISTANVITPKVVTVGAISDALQGQLIKIKNVTFTSIDNSGASIAQDSTGNINVYAMPVVAGLAVGDTADVTAAVTRYTTALELAVDSAADVVKTGGTIVTPAAATISVVATSDVHGNALNFDYGTNAAPSKGQGLAKVSTYVNSLRTANPNNVMLIDNGDTIQGTPLVYYYNMIDKATAYPMTAIMGAMKYDTWTLGNHEFNYGLDTLNRVTTDAKDQGIDVLSANTYKADGTNFVKPYTMKSFVVKGKTIKVAILGLTTKTIPSWENPANYAGLHFNDLVDEAKKWVPIIKTDGADVVIVSAHTGEEGLADVIPENQAKALATQVSGIDAIVAGHAHSTLNDLSLKNPEGKVVPIVEPGKWAQNVSQIDIGLDESGTITGLTTKNVAMDSKIAEDPAITALVAPYQAKTLGYTSTVLGQSTGEYKGDKQITRPTEIMELINKVQAQAAGTQLSIAAPLSLSAYIPKGDITIKDIMGVYVYENFLYGVKMTGKQVKDWMEYTERYYKQVSSSADPIVKDPTLNIADYNLDQLYGVSYDIDLTQPATTLDSNGRVITGDRIKNLKLNGNLVKDSDVFTVAINNYRYNGGGGFMAAAGISNTDPGLVTYDSAKALGDDGQVRSLMMKYVQDNKTITPSSTNNWKFLPTPTDTVRKVTVTFNGDTVSAKGIAWYTGIVATDSDLQVVEKSATPDFTNALKFSGKSYTPTNSATELVHKAEATGLKANTSYSYRVGDATLGIWSTVGTFQTAPETGGFTFIDIADSQASTEAEATLSSETIAKSLQTISNAQFIDLNGDIVDSGSNEQQWNWLLGHSQPSLLNTTIAPAAGNHESQTNAFMDHFDLKPAASSVTTKGAYYSYDYSNAHFIVLNTNETSPEYADFTPVQIQWMKDDVAAARAAGQKWMILTIHKGPYTTADHATDSDIMNTTNGVRTLVAPIMSQLGIDLVLQGHDHIYARSKPIKVDGTAATENNISETLNGQTINYTVNPDGTIYLIPNTAGPKVYAKNKTIDPNYFNLFDVAKENPAVGYSDPLATDPIRGQIQNFEGITVDGDKLTVVSYEIDQSKYKANPYIIDQFGIEKPVVTQVTAVTLNKDVTTINVGANDILTATLAPTTATNKEVAWQSSNTAVATVDSNGKIVGVSAGTAEITVTTVDGSKTATCSVTVPDPVVLNKIAITKLATKLIYTVEEALDLTGLVVTGTYSNGSTKVETVTATNVTDFNSAVRVAKQTLTITLGGKTTSYVVKVKKRHQFNNNHHWGQLWSCSWYEFAHLMKKSPLTQHAHYANLF